MSDVGGYASVTTDDGITVESNVESKADIEKNFKSEDSEKKDEGQERKEAAAKLGKAGGEASAKAREKSEREAKAEEKTKPEAKEAEPEKKDEEPLGNPRHDPRARVMEATRKAAEEKRLRLEVEARLAKLEAERLPPKEAPAKPAGNGKPKLEDFEDADGEGAYERWVAATAEWTAERKFEALQKQAVERRAAESHAEGIVKRVQTFNDRIGKALTADPSFMERVDPRLIDLTPTFMLKPGEAPTAINDVAEAIADSEHAGALLMHLTEHPEDMARLVALPDSFSVFRAIGALEVRVARESVFSAVGAVEVSKREESVSHAHPPVRQVRGGPVDTGDEEPDENMDTDQYIRVMNARDEKRRRGAR